MAGGGISQARPQQGTTSAPSSGSVSGGQVSSGTTSAQGQVSGRGNQARQDQISADPAQAVCSADTYAAPSPVPANGELSYYSRRHNDFVTRYAQCGNFSPPDYYLGYGEKYVRRFTEHTNTLLSHDGQKWLAQARINLQVAIESRLAMGPVAFDALEKDNDAFRAFAYGTHADAYWNAGLGELSIFDLSSIGLTPDVEDLLAFAGLTQVADIGTRLLGTWGTDAIDYVAGEGTTEELVNAAYQGYVVVGDGIDEVFGPGTTAVLIEHAEELGTDALSLAEDAHGVAADLIGQGVDAIDSRLGEGTVSNTLNGAREQLQSGVETAESTYNGAAEWASEVWDDLF
jgi:hypothetical protein